LIEGYVDRIWDVNSTTASVMFGVRLFFVTRMLRGGDGHCRLNNVFVGDCMYDGFVREGSSETCLISSQGDVEEKLRACAGRAVSRRGRNDRCVNLMTAVRGYE
jgi:hypothetical protein